MNQYDKQQWQAEQAARDAALEVQRDKWAKARARSARNAKRKLERLQRKLSETEELTAWESEFTESVTERLDEFGSAFQDPQLGRPGDALSSAQKRVVAALNKKAKDQKKKNRGDVTDSEPCGGPLKSKARSERKPKSSFKTQKGYGWGKGFTPNVRNIEDELVDPALPDNQDEPFIPEYVPEPKRPFLRVVK